MSTAVEVKDQRRTRRGSHGGPTQILVASAGDRESYGALYLASALARRDEARVLAVGVASPFPQSVSALVSMQQSVSIDEEQPRATLHDLRRAVRGVPGSDGWTKRAVIGLPADAIIDVASKWNASLIVLGIGKHGRLDRIFGRETAVAVMRRARIPVLAVPPRIRALPVRAVAALDFTPASLAAAEAAAGLLASNGTLFATHVRGFRGARARPGDLVDVYRAGAQAKLNDAVRDLQRRTSRHVEAVMLEGEPGDALVRFCRGTRAEMIALGGHDQGLVDRILLGSVRTRVLRDARCSVLIAPPDAES